MAVDVVFRRAGASPLLESTTNAHISQKCRASEPGHCDLQQGGNLGYAAKHSPQKRTKKPYCAPDVDFRRRDGGARAAPRPGEKGRRVPSGAETKGARDTPEAMEEGRASASLAVTSASRRRRGSWPMLSAS